MKAFYIEILSNLYAITGNEQIKWLMREEDATAQIQVMVDEMVRVSKGFAHVPEKAQQEHIREMLVQDQDYKNLSSKQIWKWLNQIKGNYGLITEEDLTPEPKLTDEEKQWLEKNKGLGADEYIRQIQENIKKIGNRPLVNGMKELRESKGYKESLIAKEPRHKFIVGEACPECKGGGEVCPNKDYTQYPVLCDFCEGTGKIDRYEVFAFNQSEADRAYEASR